MDGLPIIPSVFIWILITVFIAIVLGGFILAIDEFTDGKLSTLAKAWLERLMP